MPTGNPIVNAAAVSISLIDTAAIDSSNEQKFCHF
jgi:hypothetical protein